MTEGGHSKLCAHTKRLCLENPAMAHTLLRKVAKSVAQYALHQVGEGEGEGEEEGESSREAVGQHQA